MTTEARHITDYVKTFVYLLSSTLSDKKNSIAVNVAPAMAF